MWGGPSLTTAEPITKTTCFFFPLSEAAEAAESDALIIILIRTDPGKTQRAIRIHGEKLKVNSRGRLPRSVPDR